MTSFSNCKVITALVAFLLLTAPSLSHAQAGFSILRLRAWCTTTITVIDDDEGQALVDATSQCVQAGGVVTSFECIYDEDPLPEPGSFHDLDYMPFDQDWYRYICTVTCNMCSSVQ